MNCIPAPACKAVLRDADHIAPRRNKASDGVCASPKHTQANPTSDHEKGEAVDVTHDPANGCDINTLFNMIIERRDPRVKYLIFNQRMCRSYAKPGIPAWTWGPYDGSNPHVKHGHISIVPEARNNTTPWFTATQEDDMTDPERQMLTDNHNRLKNAEAALQAIQKTLAEIVGRLDTAPAAGNSPSIVGSYTIDIRDPK